MFGFLRLVPLPVWIGGGAAILAGLFAFGAYHQWKGFAKAKIEFQTKILRREREVMKRNEGVDAVTIGNDVSLQLHLEELERTWLFEEHKPSASLPQHKPL